MEQVMSDLLQWRALERLLSVSLGGLSIVAGWHLFVIGVVKEQAVVIDVQSIKVRLQKVGPGVIFAAFGAWLIVSVATTQTKLTIEDTNIAGRINTVLPQALKNSDEPVATRAVSIVSAANQPSQWKYDISIAINTLTNSLSYLSEAILTLPEKEAFGLSRMKIAISNLGFARSKMMLELFPAKLRRFCKTGTNLPDGFSQDDCQNFKEYQEQLPN